MKLQDNIVSFELSKKLHSLKFKEMPLFTWTEAGEHEDTNPKNPVKAWHKTLISVSGETVIYSEGSITTNYGTIVSSKNNIFYPAYTIAELGEFLPRIIKHDLNDWSEGYYILFAYSEPIYGRESEPSVWYEDNDLHDEHVILHGTSARTEADARAQMLIWLIENGKIEIEKGRIKTEKK